MLLSPIPLRLNMNCIIQRHRVTLKQEESRLWVEVDLVNAEIKTGFTWAFIKKYIHIKNDAQRIVVFSA